MNYIFNKHINIIILILIIFATISIFQGFSNAIRNDGSQDNQWGPSGALLNHQNPYKLYLDYLKNKQSLAPPFILSQTPYYPPSGLILLWPLAYFSWPTAKILWALFNILIFSPIILWITFNRYIVNSSVHLFIILSCLFFISTPFRVIVGNGQHALFALAFYSLALSKCDKNKILSGIFAAIALFKYTLTFPLLILFMVKRRYFIVALAVMIHIATTIFVSLWINTSPIVLLKDYYLVVSSACSHGYLDIFALSHNLGIASKIIPLIVSCIFIIIIAYVFYRCRPVEELVMLSILSVVSILIIFHLPYDFIIMIYPMVYIFETKLKTYLSYLFASCILSTWYMHRIISSFSLRYPDTSTVILSLIYWLKVILLYSTVIFALHVIWNERQNRLVKC